jgi:hypothetical protein
MSLTMIGMSKLSASINKFIPVKKFIASARRKIRSLPVPFPCLNVTNLKKYSNSSISKPCMFIQLMFVSIVMSFVFGVFCCYFIIKLFIWLQAGDTTVVNKPTRKQNYVQGQCLDAIFLMCLSFIAGFKRVKPHPVNFHFYRQIFGFN